MLLFHNNFAESAGAAAYWRDQRDLRRRRQQKGLNGGREREGGERERIKLNIPPKSDLLSERGERTRKPSEEGTSEVPLPLPLSLSLSSLPDRVESHAYLPCIQANVCGVERRATAYRRRQAVEVEGRPRPAGGYLNSLVGHSVGFRIDYSFLCFQLGRPRDFWIKLHSIQM